ncbi:MAG: alpha/beta hydrolase, partial [Ardenticatenaceae bacterium]
MALRHTLILIIGLAFFTGIASLDYVLAMAMDSMRPLALMWLFVPVPIVFLLVFLRSPQRRHLKLASASYLGVTPVITLAVVLGVAWIGSGRALHPAECESLPSLDEYPQLQSAIENVQFDSGDGTRLSGWFIPGQTPKTVLLLHGYRCNRYEMLPHADMLHEAGYSLLLFDFRNRGESGGDAVTLGYHERGDVLGAIDYLKTRPDVDMSGFGVLGISQGGATAILASAETQDITAVASEAPFRSLNSVISQSFEHFIGLPAFPFAPLTVWMAERRVGISSEEIVPEREVAAISPRPILIMHGLDDTTVSPADGEAVYRAAKEPKELWLMPGVTHGDGAEAAPEEY